MLVMLLSTLNQTVVATALPKIASELNGLSQLSWLATAYLLTAAVTTPLYGKISDLFGRKKIFQIAISIFLVGSILCGLSQDATQLIVSRAIQGIGAGGLMALVQAIIGDIIPPRERGRYMGYLAGTFGAASVLGPLVGGFLTDSLSWRWIFLINIPLCAAALWAVTTRLHLPIDKRPRHIDYTGALLLLAGTTSLLLAAVWAGSTYAWGSQIIISLLVSAGALGTLFVFWERRAREPIIPIRLFRNSIFSASVVISMLAGIAMFAAILYIPVYQQIVRNMTPTKSGLFMLPLVIGLVGASVGVGRLISKYGRYKIFPLLGTLILALGLWLFSHVSVNTSEWTLGIWMFIIGAGLGSFMQVTMVSIQNSVDHRDLGTATASLLFFRGLGASLGGAIFGALLIGRFSHHLNQLGLQSGQLDIDIHKIQGGASQIQSLPPAVASNVLEAFTRSFQDVFLVVTPFALLAFVVALFLREVPLRTTRHGAADN